MEDKKYPLIIIGAGPAGLAASIYASRYGIEHVLIGGLPGGVISETHLIDNYPGMENISGFEFAQKMINHAKKYKPIFIQEKAEKLGKKEKLFYLETDNKNQLSAKTILIATGTRRRKLNIPGEEKFLGKGVSYCATCDGTFFKNKTVAVIGGNDSAVGAADYLAAIASQVYLIYRKKELRAEPYWINLVKNNPKIKIIYNTNLISIDGQKKVEKIKLDQLMGKKDNLAVDGVFIEIGAEPDTQLTQKLSIKKDENGFIKVNNDGSTDCQGVWAAGDITTGSDGFCQVVTAVAEGAVAVRSIFKYLKNADD
jgi:thioredoxin reductase (NADPH)